MLCRRRALNLIVYSLRAWAVSVEKMGQPRKVAFFLALFVLLGTLHGTRAKFDDYDYEDYEDYEDFKDS